MTKSLHDKCGFPIPSGWLSFSSVYLVSLRKTGEGRWNLTEKKIMKMNRRGLEEEKNRTESILRNICIGE
jgi:hypothetical protein